jgi:hypothetical protein
VSYAIFLQFTKSTQLEKEFGRVFPNEDGREEKTTDATGRRDPKVGANENRERPRII